MSAPYSIFLPSDFSPASEPVFAHALAIAVIRKARMTLLHAGGFDWGAEPLSVRPMLARWGLLEEGAARDAVYEDLRVRVQKIEARERDPYQASLEYLRRDPADLLVLGTEGRRGLPRWRRRSIAERIARKTGLQAIFVPTSASGFIDPADGRSSLRRVLLPLPNPATLTAAIEARRLSSASVLQIEVRHNAGEPPPMVLPDRDGVRWSTVCEPASDLADWILDAARATACDLIILPADPTPGWRARIRGTVAERVLRASPCPVLVVR